MIGLKTREENNPLDPDMYISSSLFFGGLKIVLTTEIGFGKTTSLIFESSAIPNSFFL